MKDVNNEGERKGGEEAGATEKELLYNIESAMWKERDFKLSKSISLCFLAVLIKFSPIFCRNLTAVCKH